MKYLRQGACLALLGAGLVATPTLQAAAEPTSPPSSDRGLVQQMKKDADGSVTVTRKSATGKVGFVRAGRNGDLLPQSAASPAAKVDEFLDTYAPVFGSATGQLVRTEISRDDLGTTITYEQEYRGLPVFASQLRAHVDKRGDLTGVNGTAVPDLSLSVTPRLTQAAAADRAVQAVRADPPGDDGRADTSGVTAVATELLVYRMGLLNGEQGEDVLAYRVEVTNEKNIRDVVFVSADSGKPVNRYSMIDSAVDRELYEADEDRKLTLVWEEGDPLPGTLNDDQDSMVRSTGDAYWFFANAFGRDSYDGLGATMRTVNNDPAIACPNANWNGVTTNYCDGVSSDDVVAHEWGHAYSEYSHGLIYQWQPGALNESYSDIWGETIDLINGRQDSDEGDITAERPVGQCSTHSPAKPVVKINAPSSIAKDCQAGAASFGAPLTGQGITGDVVVGTDDEAAPGPATTDACSPLTNAAAVTGHVALVDRGGCGFAVKVKNAQDAGATSVLVADNVEATPAGMSGTDPAITIPSVRIRLSDGDLIKGALGSGPVNVTLKDASGDRVDSYRWLMGEDSDAFGGAIRDMWSPTCHGDPGKVSDAEYYCASDDSGGVHSNSGVPNHGYSLLVDGGDYNGTTVPGIGLTKAAHIYFRAMTEYQTPASDFSDHADALSASCTDLTGQPLNALNTTAKAASVSDQVVTATDCAAVGAMAQAVELREDPTQCNFRPLLTPGKTDPCAGEKRNTVWGDKFDKGLRAWAVADDSPLYEGADNLAWTSASTLPGDRAGRAAVGPDPAIGSCAGDADDISGRTTMTSPAIDLPGSRKKATRVSFMHYVATETGWDGGNVKVSVNGGGFEVVPSSAYLVNAPNSTLQTTAAGNTNPLAGEEAFTGTDGGKVTGSWGQSVIDLSMVDVKPGDSIQVQFDMGRDGCNGIDGWYVDDVEVSTCKAGRPGRHGDHGKHGKHGKQS